MTTKFNPEGKDALNHGECLGPAMTITDQADADQYFNDYVAHIQRHLDGHPEQAVGSAAEIARSNLGYYAGYYDDETRLRVERLFRCEHPVFGPAAQGQPTLDQAVEMGVAAWVRKGLLS